MSDIKYFKSLVESALLTEAKVLIDNFDKVAALMEFNSDDDFYFVQIIKRYKDNKTVVAYDILNEPQNNGGYDGEYSWSAESEDAVSRTNKVYDILYKAIREIDKNHIISFEGVWYVKSFNIEAGSEINKDTKLEIVLDKKYKET